MHAAVGGHKAPVPWAFTRTQDDEIVERKLYEGFGVHESWTVDPELDAIKAYGHVEGTFTRTAELTAERGDFLTTPLLPGFSVPLPEIFPSPICSCSRTAR